MNQADIEQRLRGDAEVQLMLAAVERIDLPDWWICAGVLRSKVWGIDQNAQSDIDIVYFDPSDSSEATEKRHERQLCKWLDLPWSVKNQARMHLVNELPPYASAQDAISQFPETVTAIGVTRRPDFELYLPYGASDFTHRIIRPTPPFQIGTSRHSIFQRRVIEKGWQDDVSLHIYP
ncbi:MULTISPECIES: nucleotidyltransferase family protein [Exiguobacterium]|uniref:nucleotidyltransferase family protein n=1 Tax=Exiguobacterium sp. UBA1053 TaxID=1946487 RepID=UPI0025B97F10|nr:MULTISPECIES: nucleotidyltransferase family protein [Exiguobacterium]